MISGVPGNSAAASRVRQRVDLLRAFSPVPEQLVDGHAERVCDGGEQFHVGIAGHGLPARNRLGGYAKGRRQILLGPPVPETERADVFSEIGVHAVSSSFRLVLSPAGAIPLYRTPGGKASINLLLQIQPEREKTAPPQKMGETRRFFVFLRR